MWYTTDSDDWFYELLAEFYEFWSPQVDYVVPVGNTACLLLSGLIIFRHLIMLRALLASLWLTHSRTTRHRNR